MSAERTEFIPERKMTSLDALADDPHKKAGRVKGEGGLIEMEM